MHLSSASSSSEASDEDDDGSNKSSSNFVRVCFPALTASEDSLAARAVLGTGVAFFGRSETGRATGMGTLQFGMSNHLPSR